MVSFLKSVHVLNYFRFSNIELSLHSWVKSNSIVVYCFLSVLFHLILLVFCLRFLHLYSWIRNLKKYPSTNVWYQDDSVCVKRLGSICPFFLFSWKILYKTDDFFSLKVWENFCVKPSEPSFSLWEYFKILLQFLYELQYYSGFAFLLKTISESHISYFPISFIPASISNAFLKKNFLLPPLFQLTLTLNMKKGIFCFLWSCFDKGANGSPWYHLKRILYSFFFFWPLCFILRWFTSHSFLKLSTPCLLWHNSFLLSSNLSDCILKISLYAPSSFSPRSIQSP